jgi:hypothetical protein
VSVESNSAGLRIVLAFQTDSSAAAVAMLSCFPESGVEPGISSFGTNRRFSDARNMQQRAVSNRRRNGMNYVRPSCAHLCADAHIRFQPVTNLTVE